MSTHKEAAELGKLLLRMGIALVHGGASTHKIRCTLLRVANSFEYVAHVDVSTKAVDVSIHKQQDEDVAFNGVRAMAGWPGVNFNALSEISRLSWSISEDKLSIAETKEEFERIIRKVSYPRLVVLCMVALASAAFCKLFGGDWIQLLVTFVASFAGLALKQQMVHGKFNPFLTTYTTAFATSLIVQLVQVTHMHQDLHQAFATCSLFLIPGVPLITSIMDLLEGYTINGVDRGITSLLHAFSIAAGIATNIYLFHNL